MKKLILFLLFIFFIVGCNKEEVVDNATKEDNLNIPVFTCEVGEEGNINIIIDENNYDGYEIYRSNSVDSDYSLIYVTSSIKSSYTLSEKDFGKLYYYKVRGFKNNISSKEYSEYSEVVEFTLN